MLIVWIIFIIFSQSSADDTWNSLLATCHKFLPKDGYYCSETENDQTITLLSKKKPQNLPLHPLAAVLKNFQKIHAKGLISSLNDQKTWAKFLHSRETSQNCSSEHIESCFDNPAIIFSLIVQTFLLEVRRCFKKQFFYKFFPPSFFLY